jgi:hypothetical protein
LVAAVEATRLVVLAVAVEGREPLVQHQTRLQRAQRAKVTMAAIISLMALCALLAVAVGLARSVRMRPRLPAAMAATALSLRLRVQRCITQAVAVAAR